jgi:hypothetical protein
VNRNSTRKKVSITNLRDALNAEKQENRKEETSTTIITIIIDSFRGGLRVSFFICLNLIFIILTIDVYKFIKKLYNNINDY